MSKLSVVVVAGGTGSRMGSKVKKQYLQLKGKEVLARTIEVFNRHPEVDEIVVVTGIEDIPYVERLLKQTYKYEKVSKIVEGGKERQDSVYNGINAVSQQAQYVMIHDGARPLVTPSIISKALLETEHKGATIVAVPVKDTIKRANRHHEVIETPPRETLWSVQTPQTFKSEIIKQAHKDAKEKGRYGTDDAMLVEWLGEKVTIIQGEYTNIKITTPEDLIIAERLIEEQLSISCYESTATSTK